MAVTGLPVWIVDKKRVTGTRYPCAFCLKPGCPLAGDFLGRSYIPCADGMGCPKAPQPRKR